MTTRTNVAFAAFAGLIFLGHNAFGTSSVSVPTVKPEPVKIEKVVSAPRSPVELALQTYNQFCTAESSVHISMAKCLELQIAIAQYEAVMKEAN